jgi:hypothetical protein
VHSLSVARSTVRRVIESGQAKVPELTRAELAEPWRETILDLQRRYEGHLGRVHEELLKQGANLSYPALTAFCRHHGIGCAPPMPAGHYEFAAGSEMQQIPVRIKRASAECSPACTARRSCCTTRE